MVVKPEIVIERLKSLDTVLQELSKYQSISWETFSASLSQQWIIERGLIAAASIIFDVADHILAGHFGLYAKSYEDSLVNLQAQGVISRELYQQIKGLDGFRNILIHRYFDLDPHQTYKSFQRGMRIFPQFAQEILAWLDALDPQP